MSDTLKRECPHCRGSLDKYEDPVAVKLIDSLTRELATKKHWLGDLERIQQLERELTAERIGHVTQTNMAQRLFDELSHLREGVEKLTEEVKHGTQPHGGVDDPDEIKLEDFAHKLRALLK